MSGAGPWGRVWRGQVLGRAYSRSMDTGEAGELEGQTSINELLDDPVGLTHVQMVLPIYVKVGPGNFRRLS